MKQNALLSNKAKGSVDFTSLNRSIMKSLDEFVSFMRPEQDTIEDNTRFKNKKQDINNHV